jgi:hypothetical protein
MLSAVCLLQKDRGHCNPYNDIFFVSLPEKNQQMFAMAAAFLVKTNRPVSMWNDRHIQAEQKAVLTHRPQSHCHGRQFTPSTRVNAGNHKPY